MNSYKKRKTLERNSMPSSLIICKWQDLSLPPSPQSICMTHLPFFSFVFLSTVAQTWSIQQPKKNLNLYCDQQVKSHELMLASLKRV